MVIWLLHACITMTYINTPLTKSRLHACKPPVDKNFPTSHCAGWSPVQHNKRHRITAGPGLMSAIHPL